MTGEKEDDIFRDVYGEFLLGKTQFIKEKLKELKIQVETDEISYSKELHLRIEPGLIIKADRKIRSQVNKLNSIFED